jgi:hypothetical protein
MNIEAVIQELREDPNAHENAKFYRELLDNSELSDTDSLRQFVDGLVKQNESDNDGEEGEEEKPVRKPAGDHRRALDRSMDIEYYTAEALGPTRERTPEGFLICYDVPVARTGEMIYGPGETPIKTGNDGRVKIQRDAKEVFAPKSIASLNGKPVTDDHPPVDVDPDNWRFYTRGVVVNPRRGDGEHKDCLVADMIIFDAETIRDIELGKREVSCGYNPDYLEVLDANGVAVPGEGEQANIIYNHLALVDRGRCGAKCSIGDRKTTDAVAAAEAFWSRRRLSRLRRLADRC